MNHFFNAVIEDKIPLTSLVNEDIYQHFKKSFLLNKSFYESYGKIEFDKEIESLMDEKTKKLILTQSISKFFPFNIQKILQYIKK